MNEHRQNTEHINRINETPVSMNIGNNFILARVSQNDLLHENITMSLNGLFVGTGMTENPYLNIRFATYYVKLIRRPPYLKI